MLEGIFESILTVVFQDIFELEIHQNNIFIF
jgi:hypothetical protein